MMCFYSLPEDSLGTYAIWVREVWEICIAWRMDKWMNAGYMLLFRDFCWYCCCYSNRLRRTSTKPILHFEHSLSQIHKYLFTKDKLNFLMSKLNSVRSVFGVVQQATQHFPIEWCVATSLENHAFGTFFRIIFRVCVSWVGVESTHKHNLFILILRSIVESIFRPHQIFCSSVVAIVWKVCLTKLSILRQQRPQRQHWLRTSNQ